MKRIAFLISGICLLPSVALAQNFDSKNSRKSFEEFRNRIHNNYNQFRETILEHYADFLNGEWHEYESLNGLKRDETPKPEEAPHVDFTKLPEPPSKPSVTKEPEPIAEAKPEAKPEPKPEVKPEAKPEPKPEVKPEAKPEPKPEVKPEAKPEPKPEVKPEAKPEPKPEVKPEAKPEPKPEVKPEAKPEPKPEVKPEAKPEPKPEVKPEVKPEPKPEVKPEAKPEPKPEVKPEAKPEPKPEVKPEAKPEPKAESKPSTPSTTNTPSAPSIPKTTNSPSSPTLPSLGKNGFEFAFYDIPMELVDINFNIASNLANPSDFADQWKNLEADKVGEKMLPAIKKQIEKLGLNDYLTYKYLESYVNAKFPNVSNSSKMALVHYLLVHLGYDARIAVTTKGTPILLIPFKQTVYGRSYLALQNQRYYIFPPEGIDVNTIFSEKVMTCQLPSNVDTGNTFDLVLGELNIPVKPKSFNLEYGPLHLTGEMNENLIPILYRYPQMPIEDYAKSNLQPGLRNQLTQQVKDQLGNMPGDDAVEALLHFTQNAFQYATDDNYHGFEKPYFVEETLYYPKNDCEDRAIFYTYFLYNALGRDAQLVSFPGHEAATVTLQNPKGGVSYQYDGKTYYISDPTYIGASTGMVMPSYINTVPEIDYTYSKK